MAWSYAEPRSSSGKATCPPTKPPAAASEFEYWKSAPKSLVGLIVASVFIAPSHVTPLYWNSHSKSCRGSPVHAQMRCFTSTRFVVSGSPSWNDGSSCVTGVSHVSFPSSRSFASISVVSAFVFDAMMYSVSPSGFTPRPSSFSPNPSANTTLPSCTIPTDTPVTPSFFRPFSTYAESSASAFASSLRAAFPAKLSRS